MRLPIRIDCFKLAGKRIRCPQESSSVVVTVDCVLSPRAQRIRVPNAAGSLPAATRMAIGGMNHKRKDIRGHIRRKYFHSWRASVATMQDAQKKQTKKAFMRFMQTPQNGDMQSLEDERA